MAGTDVQQALGELLLQPLATQVPPRGSLLVHLQGHPEAAVTRGRETHRDVSGRSRGQEAA